MTEIPSLSQYPVLSGSQLQRIMPEPKSNLAQTLFSAAKGLVEGGASLSGIDSKYSSLIEKQMEMQEQMMLVSLVSNVEKTRHETRMAPVRNLRVS